MIGHMIYCFYKPIHSDTVPQRKPLTSMGINQNRETEKHKMKKRPQEGIWKRKTGLVAARTIQFCK